MHISDLEYVQMLAEPSSITGGEFSVEALFRARIENLRQETNSSLEELSSRSQGSGGANASRSRATGGNFSRVDVSVPTSPDVSARIISGTVPESNS